MERESGKRGREWRERERFLSRLVINRMMIIILNQVICRLVFLTFSLIHFSSILSFFMHSFFLILPYRLTLIWREREKKCIKNGRERERVFFEKEGMERIFWREERDGKNILREGKKEWNMMNGKDREKERKEKNNLTRSFHSFPPFFTLPFLSFFLSPSSLQFPSSLSLIFLLLIHSFFSSTFFSHSILLLLVCFINALSYLPSAFIQSVHFFRFSLLERPPTDWIGSLNGCFLYFFHFLNFFRLFEERKGESERKRKR